MSRLPSTRVVAVAWLAGLLLMGARAPVAHGQDAAESLVALRAAVSEGRFARAYVEARELARPLQEAWLREVFSAIGPPPAGWTEDTPGQVVGASAEGLTLSRSISRGQGAAGIRFVVHTHANENDKPHEANAPWFIAWQGSPRARDVPWGERQALLLMEQGETGGKEVGLRLAHGGSLGLLAYGLASADLLALARPMVDVARLERALDRGRPAGHVRALADVTVRAWREGRHAACFEALRLLRADLAGRCRGALAGLLDGAPAGWKVAWLPDTEGGESLGLGREWSRGEHERLSARLAWSDAPEVNGWLDALRSPERRAAEQRVVTLGGRPTLVEEPRLEGDVRRRSIDAHVFFFDGHARLDVRSVGVGLEGGIAPLLTLLQPARIEERLAPLW